MRPRVGGTGSKGRTGWRLGPGGQGSQASVISAFGAVSPLPAAACSSSDAAGRAGQPSGCSRECRAVGGLGALVWMEGIEMGKVVGWECI